MDADSATLVANQLMVLERRQRRTSRWLLIVGFIVLLQAATIAYLIIPFGGAAKHPITLKAGRFEVIDENGMVRAVLTADPWQTSLSMSDAKENSRILLRDNEAGFSTMEFTGRISNEKVMNLFAGGERSQLELRGPKARGYLNAQAAKGATGVTQSDE